MKKDSEYIRQAFEGARRSEQPDHKYQWDPKQNRLTSSVQKRKPSQANQEVRDYLTRLRTKP